jgi:hypothetical protein
MKGVKLPCDCDALWAKLDFAYFRGRAIFNMRVSAFYQVHRCANAGFAIGGQTVHAHVERLHLLVGIDGLRWALPQVDCRAIDHRSLLAWLVHVVNRSMGEQYCVR